MSSGDKWTIERICEALGSPALSQRFLAEINKAPATALLDVFEKWVAAAERMQHAMTRGRELAALEGRGEGLPANLIDRTEQVFAKAEQIRARGAA
ncbi:hypothetical protein [Streptomyces hoynatensis]|uniref:Uncharacterized protein n=1 Tax=Streptomyces hoynatensis TaxID=1141874 RepID=A0A3A9YLE2_9ACTN|nr:hypothetical protein [Streptomyces hoynatensis]RKN34966.1 hypothetical protein D7294_31325 [Streptomyces hoynatensis]